MGLRTKKRNLGGHGARAYYTEHPRPALMALEHGLSPAEEEALLVEGEGYYRKRPPKGGRRFSFEPRTPYDFDPTAVEAMRSVIDELRPEWVEQVRDACRISADPYWLGAYLDMSPCAVYAIVKNFIQRGELPQD